MLGLSVLVLVLGLDSWVLVLFVALCVAPFTGVFFLCLVLVLIFGWLVVAPFVTSYLGLWLSRGLYGGNASNNGKKVVGSSSCTRLV